MQQFAAGTHSPCALLGDAEPPRFAHTPWMLVLRLLLGGSWLHKPGQVRLASQNCCTHSSGSLDLWVCMHALRPINENKVITGKLQGQRMATARGPAQNCKVCAENKLGTQALLCHLLKRHLEGTLPPTPCFNVSQKKVSLPGLEFSPGASQARINCWPHKLFLLY